jgi:hypothetical protein
VVLAGYSYDHMETSPDGQHGAISALKQVDPSIDKYCSAFKKELEVLTKLMLLDPAQK